MQTDLEQLLRRVEAAEARSSRSEIHMEAAAAQSAQAAARAEAAEARATRAEQQVQAATTRCARAERRLRAFGSLAAVVALVGLWSAPVTRAVAQGYGVTLQQLASRLTTLEQSMQALSAQQLPSRTSALESKTQYMSVNGSEMYITGANLNIRNGAGVTQSTNGRGNLVLGYKEGITSQDAAGSHNLVIGEHNRYPSFGGLMMGYGNAVTGPYAAVLGGSGNTASGSFSTVLGGYSNTTQGNWSVTLGGEFRTAASTLQVVGP